MESIRTILPEDFHAFIDDFSRVHAGQEITISVFDRELQPTNIAKDQPLLGLSYNEEPARQLEVAVGHDTGDYLRHVVGDPKAMRISVDDVAGDRSLEIDTESGPQTLLRLH